MIRKEPRETNVPEHQLCKYQPTISWFMLFSWNMLPWLPADGWNCFSSLAVQQELFLLFLLCWWFFLYSSRGKQLFRSQFKSMLRAIFTNWDVKMWAFPFRFHVAFCRWGFCSHIFDIISLNVIWYPEIGLVWQCVTHLCENRKVPVIVAERAQVADAWFIYIAQWIQPSTKLNFVRLKCNLNESRIKFYSIIHHPRWFVNEERKISSCVVPFNYVTWASSNCYFVGWKLSLKEGSIAIIELIDYFIKHFK